MKKIILFILVILLLLISYILYSSWKHKENEDIELSDSFYLSPNDIKKYEKQALAGDSGATIALDQYYRIYKNDFDTANKWQRVGVQKGYDWALRDYGYNLCNTGHRNEGVKYLEKACAKGYSEACNDAKQCSGNK